MRRHFSAASQPAHLRCGHRAFAYWNAARFTLRATMWSPKIFKRVPPRDLLLFGFGCWIGAQLQVFCWVEGRSMLPTLHPGELMLRVNCGAPTSSFSLLHVLKWWLGVSSAAEALNGRVVVVQVKSDGTLLCKRVRIPIRENFVEALESSDEVTNDDETLMGEVDWRGDQVDAAAAEPRRSYVGEDGVVVVVAPRAAEAQHAGITVISPGDVEQGANAVFAGAGSSNDDAAQSRDAFFAEQERKFEERMIAELEAVQQLSASTAPSPSRHHASTPHRTNHYMRQTEWQWCFDHDRHGGRERNGGVAEEFLWLEGDNPRESLDSRAVGDFPVECFRGLPLAVIWPLGSARLIR